MFEALPLTGGKEQSHNIEYVCPPHQQDGVSVGTCQFRIPASWENRQSSHPWAPVGVMLTAKATSLF